MDELSLIQILARARAVLTDESGVAAVTVPASAVRGNAGVQEKAAPATELRCYACNEMNHLARDWLLRQRGRWHAYGGRSGGRGGGRGEIRCYRCDGLGHCVDVSGKRERGEAFCARLHPRHPLSAVLPVTEISVDDVTCVALVDSGCSHCIVYAPYCASWTRKSVSVLTVSGRVQLRVRGSDSVMVAVYVVDFKPGN